MKTLLILFIAINLYADIKQEMFSLYQNKKYEKVCKLGFKNFPKYRQNEEYISLYAFACLKSDYIDRLTIPIATLKYSKESRANSAYLSIILMQKKLLYHALVDNYELSSLKLPSTDYVLSKVFDLYVKLGKHKSRTFYLFEDEDDSKLTYKLFLLKDTKLSKMVVEEYYNSIVVKRHVYW
ncbi:MAG: hypothetical protein L3J19_06560 [Sulfurimonas sp.]|nr:hypothetical protein [Sulfurimonas sp.]